MADVVDSKLEPILLDIVSSEQVFPTDLEKVLTPREFHRCGLELFAQGYLAQAELCFRVSRRSAIAHDQVTLGVIATIDLVRSLSERNPQLAIQVLRTLNPDQMDMQHACSFFNVYGQALHSTCSYDMADKYYLQSINIASESKNILPLAIANANRSTLLFEHGAYREARRFNIEALEIFEGMGQDGRAGFTMINMAANAMLERRYDDANDLFDRITHLNEYSTNIKLRAFSFLNNGELQLLAGNLDKALELFGLAERHATMASLPATQVNALLLKTIMEGKMEANALLEAVAASARDLHDRELAQDSAPLTLLATAFAGFQGQAIEPYLSALNPTFAALHQAQVMLDHCQRMLAGLKEKRRGTPVQSFPKFLTQSPAMTKVKDKLSRLIGSDVRILIEGETGTGKSFLARQFHDANGQSTSPFIIVDCTNLEENLFESKLFGHLRGSFTGAISDTIGLVEQANGGTLFLDEIGEVPIEIQGKLLYTIEEQRYRPVGAKQERRSEFRLIAATNRDVDQMLEAGTLRRDLFFRLAGFRLTLPPLRERREDIVPLVELRLEQLNKKYRRRKSIRSDVWDSLVQYNWPGNVRELNTALERGYHLSTGRRIALDDLALGLSPDGTTTEDLTWYSVRREHLLRVLRLCRGNVARAAQLLGVNRTTLIYKLKLLDIERRDFAPARVAASPETNVPPSDNSDSVSGFAS